MPDPNAPPPKGVNESTETPEDVATLYSWANLHGAKYRDFSATRALAREAARQRVEEAAAAERIRREEEAERIRQEEAQLAAREAAEAAEAARLAEAERLAELARQAEIERQAVLAAQEAQRQAAQQRAWQSAPSAFAPVVPAPQPAVSTASAATPRPASFPQAVPVSPTPVPLAPVSPVTVQAERSVPPPAPPSRAVEAPPRETKLFSPATPVPPPLQAYQEPSSFFSAPAFEEQPPTWPGSGLESEAEPAVGPSWLSTEIPVSAPEAAPQRQIPIYAQPVASQPAGTHLTGTHLTASQPAGSQPTGLQPQEVPPVAAYSAMQFPSLAPAAAFPVPPTLTPYAAPENGSQRNSGTRWFALKSVFDPQAPAVEQPLAQQPAQAPVLAVFSLAGGVGKTSIIASLGRALSTRGEHLLLVDTTAYGLLPFFFGARDQRPGQLRTFNPPGASLEAPIQLITLDPESPLPDAAGDNSLADGASDRPQEWLAAEITRLGRAHHRVLVDLPSASGATTRRILRLNPTILVPVLPDMSSVVSVGAIESFFQHNAAATGSGKHAGSGKHIEPYYLLNQFDYSLPLHLDVRELLREQIGDRLLPFTLRRSPAVSEALAEGMTVMDYAPSAPLAEDFSSLAGWVRSLAAPAVQTNRGVRWSER